MHRLVVGGLNMKKIVPMTLILLMFASVFASTAWIDLNENEKSDAADGRAAQDAAIHGIHEPRASSLDPMTGEWRNTVKAGEPVSIVAAIQNLGDDSITEMNVEATVYLEDGTVAVDAGPDGQLGTSDDSTLSWTDSVICDDANACSETSLETGAWLSGGSYSVRDSSGAPISWDAPLGAYTIAVEVDLPGGDDDEDNNMAIVDIQVVNWYDIGVSLAWDSGAEKESGAGTHDYTLTVSSDGSEYWSAREVIVDLIITEEPTGTLDGGTGTSTLTAGTSQDVEVFFNMSAPCDDTNGDGQWTTADDGDCDPRNGNATRTVVDYQSSWTHSGSVTLADNADGSYTISAVLRNYTIYGAAPECLETWEDESADADGNVIRTTNSSQNICEVSVETDDNNSNNEDDISGYIGSFHDIALTSVAVAQGYDAMGQGEATTIASDGDIGVGYSMLYATVEHRGSPGTGPYDWQVDFTVTDLSDDTTTSYTADECPSGVGAPYVHDMIGDTVDSHPFGTACVGHNFSSGKYKVEAAVSMVGGDGTTDDENSANDDAFGMFDARNNDPVLSLSLQSQGDIKIGDVITFDANAFDAEDLTGESLTYDWNRVTIDGINTPLVECNADAQNDKGYRVCTVLVDQSWATTLPVSVTVTDPHGGEDSATTEVMVWNVGLASGNSADGAVSVEYTLTYNAASAWEINVSDGDAETGVMLGSAEADSMYVLDLALTHMDSSDVLEQSLTVTFPGSADEDYGLYWKNDQTNWADGLLDGTAVQVNSTHMSFTWDGGDLGGTLYSGSLGIFNAAADTGEVPANGIANAWYQNLAGGQIVVKWNLTNNGADLLETDTLEVCTSADACSNLGSATAATQHIITGDHGEQFNVTVSVTNTVGANPAIGTFTATADAAVDPAPSVAFGEVTNGSSAWTIALTVSDAGDADSFHVCWKNGPFSAAMFASQSGVTSELSCVKADKADTSVDVTKPGDTVHVVYHFAIYAEDEAGNIVATDASTTIDRWGTSSGNTNTDGTLGDDLEAEQGVPTWAWGIIIGIVVVAFGIGAFILSRGGEGGEGKEWDY